MVPYCNFKIIMNNNQIQKKLQSILEIANISDVVIKYVEPNEFRGGYWDYRKTNGGGFSSPCVNDFIVDVIYETGVMQ